MSRFNTYILIVLFVLSPSAKATEPDFNSYCANVLRELVDRNPNLKDYPDQQALDHVGQNLVPQRAEMDAKYGPYDPGRTLSEKQISAIVETYREMIRNAQNHDHATTALRTDPELEGLAREEIRGIEAELSQLAPKLREQLIDHLDPENRARLTTIEIDLGGGASNEMVQSFARDLQNYYGKMAMDRGWKVSVGVQGGSGNKKLRMQVTGTGSFALFKHEAGKHQIYVTQRRGKTFTQSVTVSVLPLEQNTNKFSMNDVRVDTYSASGPGGQHVNRTASAVRMVHNPTGISVESQNQRSQHQNRAVAEKNLRQLVSEHYQREFEQAQLERRREQTGTGQRGEIPKIRTYDFVNHRLTDHRTQQKVTLNGGGLENVRLDSFFPRLENNYLRILLLNSQNSQNPMN